MKSHPCLALCLCLLASVLRSFAAPLVSPPEFQDWPAGASPQEIGLRVAENFSTHPFEWQGSGPHPYVIYPEICAWYGSLTVAQLAGATDLRQRLLAKYDPLLLPENANKIKPDAHVDFRIFGVVPLEFHQQRLGDRWLSLGRSFADAQWEKTTPDGITVEARYWIDDMYMSPILQVQAYRATGEPVYLDRAARMMVAYLDKLQQPTGLFLHAPDSPFYWGRGNGWVAAGMTELLRELPATHPQQARILAGYRLMMAALLADQGSDGLWKQLVDKPESWGETSGTGMFTFAIVTGVREGWLDAKRYAPAARKAWLALVSRIDADANLQEICVGTNKAKMVVGEDLQKQYEFYLARPRRTGDLHGQAPLLWTASAFLR
ncbi:MAG: glycoside hydrolase family 88 protein [Opitutaceae bacterium]|nr:glycoside hydrolase family 88 protein [Opitutaceae bacterium]